MSDSPPRKGQLTFSIERARFPDRNLDRGGRSFYFFDFDDNVMFLDTPIFLYDAVGRREISVSTGHFARISHLIGKPGPYENFRVEDNDQYGSFRRFRDPGDAETPFIEDVAEALGKLDVAWKGPSWDLFEHAVHNARPLSIITARGHAPRSIEKGVGHLYEQGLLSRVPNYLSVFPVSHPETRSRLASDATGASVAALKRAAIIHSVEAAMQQYGNNPHHRFGMSDDSPDNVSLAIEAMQFLKGEFQDNAFFVFDTSTDPMQRIEIRVDGTTTTEASRAEQLSLFDEG